MEPPQKSRDQPPKATQRPQTQRAPALTRLAYGGVRRGVGGRATQKGRSWDQGLWGSAGLGRSSSRLRFWQRLLSSKCSAANAGPTPGSSRGGGRSQCVGETKTVRGKAPWWVTGLQPRERTSLRTQMAGRTRALPSPQLGMSHRCRRPVSPWEELLHNPIPCWQDQVQSPSEAVPFRQLGAHRMSPRLSRMATTDCPRGATALCVLAPASNAQLAIEQPNPTAMADA